ncbi:hypothetical protein E3Q08_03658 [Wallemia mellicola]|uniref:Uncharacterized protein n=1 Tax=Wallemia mellicola TaxID=1708541 RepID=A0AB74KAJ0_9BASI|nr:hypothetical protein E3Q21_03568 [Wallemia mellicola]TIB84854.1 hypothetical protein E3Q20_03482 [Wallemia mellicola]TIC02051.1 hypothetical protein E3Q16_03586 [Wallemia mellicola]TIC21337.1 hypothetical protein E3Q12_03512 [Wallemia mellicola]TIC32872.1 hypothetical protein E3Q09_03528 [Wallemia mellicola]
MGYMPNCIEKDNLHHVEQYWTDLIEDNGSSKPNYTKEVYEIVYRNEERLTLLWVDSRKVCRTIKVSNVPLSILMPIVNSNTSHQQKYTHSTETFYRQNYRTVNSEMKASFELKNGIATWLTAIWLAIGVAIRF